ncbi:hypothetical protein V6Z11_A05G288500 [Gossypium hirsutum]
MVISKYGSRRSYTPLIVSIERLLSGDIESSGPQFDNSSDRY